MIKQLYTPQEAAELLHVSRRTVYSYIKDGKLEASKLNAKRILIPEESINHLLEAHRIEPEGATSENYH